VTSSFGKMTLICNTRAGRRGAARWLPEIRQALEDRGLEYEIRNTTRRGDATDMARAALESGVGLVVAVGGDGTIHEVVNGMLVNGVAINPDAALGVVAAGTGSDFIKTFGLPAAPRFAVNHLAGETAFPIDIGKITFERDGRQEVRYFANIAEVGVGAATVARAERMPRWLGPLVYLLAFWLSVRALKPTVVAVDLVDRTYEGKVNNIIVANGQFFGGGMRIAPKAAPTDGLFDIQIEHARKREAIALMPKVYKGQHLPHPDIEEFKRVKLSVTSDPPLLIEADGELLGHTPATFEVLRDAIKLKV
jgi:YegS/Rv2252/BmrU family lipid kinase